MWYKIAKQGSLWSRVNPEFKKQFDEILRESIVEQNFTKEEAEKYKGFIEEGVHKVIDFNLLQEKFREIVPNVLKGVYFKYNPDLKSTGAWDGSGFSMNYKYIQNIPMVKNVMKHELFHGIDNKTISNSKRARGVEFYSVPGNFQSSEFKGPNEEKITPEQEKLAKQKIREYIEKTYPGIMADEEQIDKFYRGAISAAESIKGDFDLYYGTNKEQRGIRAQVEDLFSNESIINIYEKHYKDIPNGKQIILEELYDLIQKIVNIKDTGDDYKQSNLFNYLNNETFRDWGGFLKQFELMVIRNINQQYVRQIAKYLSEFYIEMKEYFKSLDDN